MPDVVWPTSREVHAAVSKRITRLLDEHAGPISDIGRRAMAHGSGPLSEQPHSLTTVMVPGACVSAGADWRAALWPAAAAELMMAAADVFDDVADADLTANHDAHPGVLLTAAAGLLSLAMVAVVRVVEDGAPASTAVALADMLGTGFARAANGQALNLAPGQAGIGALAAYHQAAAKSGPLGALISRLGARTATDNVVVVDLLGEFGRRLGVRSQLLNDMRDAAPGASVHKADVLVGARTVPLTFTQSEGAPPGLREAQLAAWERQERERIAARGGLAAALALAEAERLRAIEALDALEGLGCPVAGLREVLG